MKEGCPTSGLILTLPNDGLGADILGTISGFEDFSYRGSMVEKLQLAEPSLEAISPLTAQDLAGSFHLGFHRFEVPFGRVDELADIAMLRISEMDFAKGAPIAIEEDLDLPLDAPIGPNFAFGGQHETYLTGFGVATLHNRNDIGQGKTVTIIDTGYRGTLPHGAWDVTTTPVSRGSPPDVNGHGTAMLTLAHSVAPGAKFNMIRAANDESVTIWSLIAALFVAATDAQSDVISMSLGFDHIRKCCYCGGTGAQRSFALECAVALVAATRNASGQLPLLVASTGNGRRDDGIKRPALFSDVVAIGSVDSNGDHSAFSNYDRTGPAHHQFCAFGGQEDTQHTVIEHCGAGDTGQCFGTSPATAYASGLFALLWALHDNVDRDALIANVRLNHVVPAGPASTHGYGLLCADPTASPLPRGSVGSGTRRIPLPRRP